MIANTVVTRNAPDLLIVAATEFELAGHDGLVCGVGPVEAAAAVARRLAGAAPKAVVNVGLAGGCGLAPCTLVVGSEAIYHDLRAGVPVLNRLSPAPDALALALSALPDAKTLPIVTSATVGGDNGNPEVEAMEGFAVLRACALAGVPAVEVRAISNEVGEEDRLRWDIPGAIRALATAIPRLQAAFG
jgi:futalosine hydrolase